MARTRNTKRLAQRFDRDYFNKPHPLRTWRRRLCALAVAAALGGVAWGLLPARRMVWSKGDLSTVHAFMRDDCGACHGPPRMSDEKRAARAGETRADDLAPLRGAGPGTGAVTDQACSSCHRGTVHHETQVSTAACASCHTEHDGSSPRAVPGERCTSCHAALTTRAGPPHVAAAITGFPAGHPELAAVAARRDPGQLKLNHEVHLWAGLRGPDGPAALTCVSCHTPDRAGKTFLPVSYEAHCRRCHALTVEDRGTGLNTILPHGDLRAAAAFLTAAYTGDRGERALGAEHAAATFAGVRAKTCGRCHETATSVPAGPGHDKLTAPGLPSIAPVAVPATWLPRARFDHRRHRELGCTACHRDAEKSHNTADLLLPAVAVCATCHSPAGGAPNACTTCHRYHPDESDKLGPGLFSLP